MLKIPIKWLNACRLFFTVHMVFCGLNLFAQNPDQEQKLTLKYSNFTLENILNDLSGLTGANFSYSSDIIPVKKQISFACTNKSFNFVLQEICKQAGIRFTVTSGYIVLKPATEKPLPNRATLFTISGIVADSATGEAMIGATIYIPESGTGTVTNNYGFYSISHSAGTYTAQAAFLGYRSSARTVQLDSNTTWNIRLKPAPYAMKEIVIQSVTRGEIVFNALAGQTSMDPQTVRRNSAALGETDMLKALDQLPGISFQSDGSSYFSVRGGAKDQNLILLDEAPVFNPSHMLGLFTPIIPEAIKHTAVYRADFPVQYGGRLSSVIDIHARDGNMMRFSGSASVSPVSTRFSLEGPFRRDKSSYFLSFRVSTFGLLVKAAQTTVENFYFTDFTSKFNFRLGQRDRLYLTLFSGKDAFINKPGWIRSGLEWGNTTGTLRWSHIYGSRLFSNTTLYASNFDYSLYSNYDKKNYWNSDITSTNLKSEFTWYINPRNNLRFGVNASGYFFNPGNYHVEGVSADTMRVSKVNSSEMVLYAGDETDITRWLKLNLGFRFSNWSNYGEAYTIRYDDEFLPVATETFAKGFKYYSKNFFEPRVSLSIMTGKTGSLKLSYNRTIQHINQINNSISPLNALEVWLPSGPNIKPQHAEIVDIGFIKTWPDAGLEFTTDVYYKELHNQVAYAGHAEMLLNPFLEGEIRQGEGYARGFEIMLRKTAGKLTGQISFAVTRSFLKIESLNNNNWYPSHQDRPVDICFSADYRLLPRWSVNLNAIYTSGMPVSAPTGFYYYRGVQVPVYGSMNNDRFPDYKRVDVGSSWRLNKPEKRFEHYFTFSIYNFFNTRNYAFLNFNKIHGANDKFYVPSDLSSNPDLVPTYRYIYSIIPSFTYSLKF